MESTSIKTMPLKHNLLAFFLICSFPASAEVAWFFSQKESSHKLALIPSYRRSNFLGNILSSRLFVYPSSDKGVYLSLSGHWGLSQTIKGLASRWIYWMDKGEWSSSLLWEKSFDPYYKEGFIKYISIPVQKKVFHIQYLRDIRDKLKMGVSFEFQERREESGRSCVVRSGKTKQNLPKYCYGFSPHELGGAVGIKLRSDTRDDIFNPSKGRLFQTSLKTGYEHYNLADVFLQAEASVSFIFSVLEEEKWVFTFAGGGSFLTLKRAFCLIVFSSNWGVWINSEDICMGDSTPTSII